MLFRSTVPTVPVVVTPVRIASVTGRTATVPIAPVVVTPTRFTIVVGRTVGVPITPVVVTPVGLTTVTGRTVTVPIAPVVVTPVTPTAKDSLIAENDTPDIGATENTIYFQPRLSVFLNLQLQLVVLVWLLSITKPCCRKQEHRDDLDRHTVQSELVLNHVPLPR